MKKLLKRKLDTLLVALALAKVEGKRKVGSIPLKPPQIRPLLQQVSQLQTK